MEGEQDGLTPEKVELQAEADFEAGRKASRGDNEPPAEEATPPEEVVEQSPEEDKQKAEEQSPALIAGLTEDELKQTLAKAHKFDALSAQLMQETRKIHGKFGEIQGKLKELSRGKRISKADLKRLSENWPEIADDLAADLESLTVGGGEPDVMAAKEEVLREVMGQLEALNTKMLTLVKPNWQETIATPEWDLFLGTLPPDQKEAIETTTDPAAAVKALNAFEEWANRGKKQQEKRDDKDKRLLRAMTPKGVAPEPSEKQKSADAEFEAGRILARKRQGLAR